MYFSVYWLLLAAFIFSLVPISSTNFHNLVLFCTLNIFYYKYDMNSNLAASLSSFLPSIRPPAYIKKMAQTYDGVVAITTEKEDWLIKEQIVCLWFVLGFNGWKIPHSLEMVLIDERVCQTPNETSFFHSHVSLFTTFRNGFFRFKNSCFIQKGSGISLSKQISRRKSYCDDFFWYCFEWWRSQDSRHWYKINFQYNIDVQSLNQLTLNIIPYSFVSFRDILSNDFDQSYLVGKILTLFYLPVTFLTLILTFILMFSTKMLLVFSLDLEPKWNL